VCGDTRTCSKPGAGGEAWEHVKKAARTKAWVAVKWRNMPEGRDKQKPRNRGKTAGRNAQRPHWDGTGGQCL